MSGQQLGSAVGLVAGFFLPGGPAVWSSIGPAVGSICYPLEFEETEEGDEE